MSPVKNVVSIVSAQGVVSLWLTFEDGTRKSYTVAPDHINHRKIVEKLKSRDFENLEILISPELATQVATEKAAEKVEKALTDSPTHLVGKAKIKDGVVYVNEVPVHNVVSQRIVELSSKGYPVEPVLRFLELVLMNPSSKSQEELYDFLANRNLPLTEDGHFLAYKRIRNDWKDIYSGKIDNSVGQTPSVPREAVDPDRSRKCSHGLHVGALEYVRWYGTGNPGTRVVICKVNPVDCVSVPRDHSHMKIRVCRYEVLYELPEGDRVALDRPLYSTNGDVFEDVDDWSEEYGEYDDVEDEYWTEGWDDDYESRSKDGLAYECIKRGLTKTRREGRDLGREKMIELLRAHDAANHNDPSGDEDPLLEEYLPEDDEVEVRVGEVWRFATPFCKTESEYYFAGGSNEDKVGTLVEVVNVNEFEVKYTPSLTNGPGGNGYQSVGTFVTHMVKVK